MKITLLGTGTSLPDKDRVQSGILVESNGEPFLFDVGSGVLYRLNQTGIRITDLEHVFISHFHIDHCSDFLTLCQSMWLSGYDKTLSLYAPPSMREWSRGVHDIAFSYLREKILLEKRILDEEDTIYLENLTITTAPTTHSTIESRAFRFEQDGKSVVFTADTAPCKEVIDLARDVDLLIHECNWLDGNHPKGVHTSPSELTTIVEKCQPKRVVLVHVDPSVVKNQDEVISTVGRRSNSEIIMSEDLMVLDL